MGINEKVDLKNSQIAHCNLHVQDYDPLSHRQGQLKVITFTRSSLIPHSPELLMFLGPYCLYRSYPLLSDYLRLALLSARVEAQGLKPWIPAPCDLEPATSFL